MCIAVESLVEESKNEGRIEGKLEEKTMIIKTMYKNGETISGIAKLLDMGTEEVEEFLE